MRQELLNWLDETTEGMLEMIQQFSQQQFNQVPFEGSWTGGQVAEHIYRAEKGCAKIWSGHVATTQRAPDANVEIIKNTFLDYTIKMHSPEFIIPSNGPHDKDAAHKAWKINREAMRKVAETMDLKATYTDFSLPGLGELTGQEWITFVYCHSTRHIRQLRLIYEKLAGTAVSQA
ncbi:DinB family protein [Pinibacter soli]|uniref:DinB family protein n=1 Tax=Pinibacter soli TaxID=3044211 RepID=A0ABT6R7L9_9BACT|nr:DinB family protein [Pinibacter soli]MDI3318560.1 DinB family protein [Pinibacter soli]